ncbi:hypothetical protein, partial [Clavibacter michiganensis]|uniref:hypothetical protein n=1 Tax=Clavibacter michiganensis TaxID=28447 RepID=UPI00292F2D82
MLGELRELGGRPGEPGYHDENVGPHAARLPVLGSEQRSTLGVGEHGVQDEGRSHRPARLARQER